MSLVSSLSFVSFILAVSSSEQIYLAYFRDNNFMADAEVGMVFAPPPVEEHN